MKPFGFGHIYSQNFTSKYQNEKDTLDHGWNKVKILGSYKRTI